MTTRRPALSLIAAAAALGLSACGSTEGGIPGSDADTLRKELGDVANFVERGDCDEIDGQLRQVRNAVVELPNSVDAELRDNLDEGVGVLEGVVASDCQEQAEEDAVQQEEVPTTETTEPQAPVEQPEEEEPPPEPQVEEPEPEPQPDPEPPPGDDLPTDELPPPDEGIPLDEVEP